jgi:hypothetical protein
VLTASSPWPGARYQWSASGGELVGRREEMVWRAPSQPGRYLVQVAADWGRRGIAVDAIVLIVESDGTVRTA